MNYVFWIEPGINSLDWLAQNLRGKVSFLSMEDTQIMEFGTAREIERYAMEQISSLSISKGGFIAYPFPTPNENNKAMLRAYINYMNTSER